MTPRKFLQWGGIILLLLGILGFVGFRVGNALYFDAGENWAHTILGIVALLAAYRASESTQRTLVGIVGVIAIVVGIWGFLVAGKASPNFFGSNLENPLDNLVHLVVGVWAFLAMRKKPGMAMG